VSAGGSANVQIDGIVSGLTVGSGGSEFVDTGGIARGTVVNSSGTETVGLGGVASGTTVSDGGTETVQNGGTALNAVILSGGIQLAFSGASIIGTMVGSGGIEVVSNGEVVNGTTLATGGAIDLPNLVFGTGGSAALDPLTGILTVTEGGHQYHQTLAGTYTNVSFRVTADTGTGTLVTMDSAPPCFVTGTRIATDRGEVVVEALEVGDRMVLDDGRTAPIVWLGRRQVACARHPNPEQVWPVRVRKNAFGPGTPHRDLFLSPDHAVFVDRVLIPVRYLINNSSITQVKTPKVTYHHVELAAHDVLIAEGLPAESYLDTGDRFNFDNGGGAVTLHPDFSSHVREGLGCAPLIITGPEIDIVRQRLAELARVLRRKRPAPGGRSTGRHAGSPGGLAA
jgi:autotransporter passenger strand-loop-strand repeat protein